jgi:DNA-binding winged helix-turn-helix (wHTH) protein
MDGLANGGAIQFEGFRLDRGLFRIQAKGAVEPVALGSRALDLLRLLAARRGELASKDEIIAAVWGGLAVEEGNLTVQISALRRILDQGRGSSCIQTVTGRGYRFTAPITSSRGESSSSPVCRSGTRSIGNRPSAAPVYRRAAFRQYQRLP